VLERIVGEVMKVLVYCNNTQQVMSLLFW